MGLAALVAAGPNQAAVAGEFDILAAPRPQDGLQYVLDDGKALSKSSFKALSKALTQLEADTGYHLNVVTLRKLLSDPDAFTYADKVLESWYPTREEGDKKGVLLVITSAREGAVTGGPAFLSAVGDDVLDGVITENIGNLAEQEKWNEISVSSVERIGRALRGEPDKAGPAAGGRPRGVQTLENLENQHWCV